ncbi:site-2 protease family protein [Candidatus Daviesbacteria bacterium]|nr:site-2 protease family protein [Candidatus Daviesbacteria bacterium]
MLFSILIFILTLLVLVLIHELGHFLMAKRFGIKVEEFGFGIPPRIWGKKIGETIYSLNALPFGGFVRLLGEDIAGRPINNRDFRVKPVTQRIIVVVAGVTMNLFLAWVIFYTVIIAQNFKIIYPTLEQGVFIGFVQENFPAQKAGVKLGEKLLAIDGKKVSGFDEPKSLIQSKKGSEVILTLADIDGGNQREIGVTPQQAENGEYLIGVAFSPLPLKTYVTFPEKLFSGITYSYDLTKLTFIGLARTISDLTGGNFEKASQSVSGPVGIATVTNGILSAGWQATLPYLWFVGVISLTLTIFNVLPIPALDGGRLLFLIVEAVFKKKVKAEVERIVHTVGFAVLLTLALLITYSDIRKMLP